MTLTDFKGFPPAGLQFLKRLKRNNNREWFLGNKTTYEDSVKKPMQQLVEILGSEFATFAPEIQASPKVSLYRIYRDTRFSKDKSPYKTHVAAVFPHRDIGKHEGAAFYFHIAPGELFVGGGLYMPLPEDLQAVREAVASDHRRFKGIVESAAFRRMFRQMTGEQLTRVPRGFAVTHPAADYLRYKQFLAARTLPPGFVTSGGFIRALRETFRTLHPFVQFLNEPIVAGRRARQRQKSLLT